MSRKTRIDYNKVFENDLDNMSDLVNAFTKKNKRVHRIFDYDDDDGQYNQSYGIRLVSVNENDSPSKTTNQKENDNNKQEKISNINVQPLSPVKIIEAKHDEILESRSPFKQPSQLSNRQNISLRRSLFHQKPINNNIICSTPSTRNQGTFNDFFGESSSRIQNISPIRKELSETIITTEDLNNIELIQPEKNQNSVAVKSLHNLEKDLREQFQIDQHTSRISNASPKRAISEPVLGTQSKYNNCSVVLEPMEISKDTISMYKKSQLSKLSTSNRTNVNTFNMIETPVARQAKHSIANNSLLVKKLALCESDSEITDDESDKIQNSTQTSRHSKKHHIVEVEQNEKMTEIQSQKSDRNSQKIVSTPKKMPLRRPSRQSRHSEAQLQNNITEDESEPEQPQKCSYNNTPKKSKSRRPSHDVAVDQQNHKNNQKTQKPASQKSKKSNRAASDDSEDEQPVKNNKKASNKISEVPQASESMFGTENVSDQVEEENGNSQKSSSNSEYESTQQDTQKSNHMEVSESETEREKVECNNEESEEEESVEKEKTPEKPQKHTKKPEKMSHEATKNDERSQKSTKNDENPQKSSKNYKSPQKLTQKCTKTVNKKQQQIISDNNESDNSDDDEEIPQPSKAATKSKKTAEKSKKSKSIPQSQSQNSETSNDEEIDVVDVADPQQFKKPDLFRKSHRDAITCNLSNVSAGSVVPSEIIESFRTLQKTGNNTVTTIPETSTKFIKPKGSRPQKVNPNKQKIVEYLRLEKSVKHTNNKNNKGKRTLYNLSFDSDEPATEKCTNNPESETQNIDPIDHELSEELDNVRRSIDTMSNTSSQPFTAEIPQNINSDNNQDNNIEKVQDVQKKTRGRPRKVNRVLSEESEIPQNINRDINKDSDNEKVQDVQRKTRGRQRKVSAKESDAEKMTTKESDDEAQKEPNKKVKLTKELRDLKRTAVKRQNKSNDESEPKTKSRKMASSDSSDEIDSETSKNTDEGFQSNCDEQYDDVWYDPMERGCKRQGLRVRKFMKTRDGKYAIQYGVFTKEDSKAAQLQKKYNIKEKEVHGPMAPFIQPANKLELIKALIWQKKLKPKEPEKKKETAPIKKKEVEKINEGASTSRQAMETESMVSYATARTNETHAGIVNRLLDNFEHVKGDNTHPIHLIETASYAISQINRLVWHQVGFGVFYSSFKEDSFDGFLKIVKGGYKKGAKTKLAVVKMTLLCGIVEIKVNDTKIRVENLGFITITRGQSYRIVNASDETAIILMNRLDDDDKTLNNS